MPLRRSALWSDPRVKPPVGAALLDKSHRLARGMRGAWLINEKAGTFVKDYVGPFNGKLINADAIRHPVPGAGTVGFKNIGSSNAQIQISPAMGMGGNVGYSIFGRWRPLGDGSSGHRLFAWGAASTRNAVVLARTTNTATIVAWFGDDLTGTNPGTENSTDLLRTIGTTYDQVANTRSLFYQGIRIAGPTAPGGTPNFTDSNYTIANFAGQQVNSQAWVDFVYLWQHRALTPNEMEWLHEEPFIMFKPVVYRRHFNVLAPTTKPIVYPSNRAVNQPPSSFAVQGEDLRRNLVGAWSMSSPGPGGRTHNHAPLWSAIPSGTDPGFTHGIINNWATNGVWKLQDGAVTLTTGPNSATNQSTGCWVDLGNPIADTDDVSVLIGWVPAQLGSPDGTGGMFGRGMDAFGSGWSIFLRHDGSDQIQWAAVLAGGQVTTSYTAAGLKVGKANFVAGRIRQGSNLAVCVNGGRIVQTNTGNSGLRSSTKGCGLGVSAGSANVSKADSLMFCFMWKQALADHELRELTVNPWKLWSQTEQNPGFVPTTVALTHAVPLDIEALQNERRHVIELPIEALQNERRHEVPLHIESAGTLSHGQLALPIEYGGEVEGGLGHVFDIFRSDAAPFPHFFDILTTEQESPLTHTFDIFTGGNGLDMTFDIFREELQNARKSEDVQRPIAEVVFNN